MLLGLVGAEVQAGQNILFRQAANVLRATPPQLQQAGSERLWMAGASLPFTSTCPEALWRLHALHVLRCA